MKPHYRKIALLTAQGMAQKEIAVQEGISRHTVQDILERLKAEYSAKSIAELIYKLCKLELI